MIGCIKVGFNMCVCYIFFVFISVQLLVRNVRDKFKQRTDEILRIFWILPHDESVILYGD